MLEGAGIASEVLMLVSAVGNKPGPGFREVSAMKRLWYPNESSDNSQSQCRRCRLDLGVTVGLFSTYIGQSTIQSLARQR